VVEHAISNLEHVRSNPWLSAKKVCLEIFLMRKLSKIIKKI
jgi:hypothetical protein